MSCQSEDTHEPVISPIPEPIHDPTSTPMYLPTMEPTHTPSPTEIKPPVCNNLGIGESLSPINIYETNKNASVRITTKSASGSGTLITPEGHIITNHHVIDGHDSVQVRIKNAILIEGSVLGYNGNLDLAVVKITDGPWDYIEMSECIPDVGSEINVVGYPFNIPGDATLTNGIVSSIRPANELFDIHVDENLTYIQSDAAINPGNSGGTGFDSFGRFIGIPTAVHRNSDNIGFLISIQSIIKEIPGLIDGNKIAKSISHSGLNEGPLPTPIPRQNAFFELNELVSTIEGKGSIKGHTYVDSCMPSYEYTPIEPHMEFIVINIIDKCDQRIFYELKNPIDVRYTYWVEEQNLTSGRYKELIEGIPRTPTPVPTPIPTPIPTPTVTEAYTAASNFYHEKNYLQAINSASIVIRRGSDFGIPVGSNAYQQMLWIRGISRWYHAMNNDWSWGSRASWFHDATKDFTELISYEPEDTLLFLWRGIFYRDLAYAQIVNPTIQGEYSGLQSNVTLRAKALADFDTSIALDPNWEAHLHKGLALYYWAWDLEQFNLYVEAENLFKTAITLYPDSKADNQLGNIYCKLSWAQTLRGSRAEGEQSRLKAIDLDYSCEIPRSY